MARSPTSGGSGTSGLLAIESWSSFCLVLRYCGVLCWYFCFFFCLSCAVADLFVLFSLVQRRHSGGSSAWCSEDPEVVADFDCQQDLSVVSIFSGLPRRVRLCVFYNTAFCWSLGSLVLHIGPRPRSLTGLLLYFSLLLLLAC